MTTEKNYFTELLAIECKVDKKKEQNYISWSYAWEALKKKQPTATYTIYENEQGFPFWESKFGIDVKVGVTVNGITHIVRLPILDGANNVLKGEPYEYTDKYNKLKKVNACDTFDINKAIMRALTKAIAMHGIGLYVYQGEDLPEEVEEVEELPMSWIAEIEALETVEEARIYYEKNRGNGKLFDKAVAERGNFLKKLELGK